MTDLKQIIKAIHQKQAVQFLVNETWCDFTIDQWSPENLITRLQEWAWRIKPADPIVREIWVGTKNNVSPNYLLSLLFNNTTINSWDVKQFEHCNKRYKVTVEEWPE
jgi:hypothetical protein